jgi:type II secretory pathway pseudopilin PulG
MKLSLKAGCRIMKDRLKQCGGKRYGSVLVLTLVVLIILSGLGLGMLAVAYGVRHQAIMLKNETAAMLAAEAGYEQAVFWMSQQLDMLTILYHGSPGTTGTITFSSSDCNYSIGFYTFIDARPVYRIVSNGHSGMFNRTVDTLLVQEISGWAMGKCRIPTGATTTSAVNYADGEIIDMPLHINKLLGESTDSRDIYISGSPQFLRPVAMGESRYAGGTDKYSGVMGLFTGGIYFDQPDTKVADEASVQSKVDRFSDSTVISLRRLPAHRRGGFHLALTVCLLFSLSFLLMAVLVRFVSPITVRFAALNKLMIIGQTISR